MTEFTPVYSKGGIVLESQRLQRRFVIGITALLACAGMAAGLFALTFAPGEIEITEVYSKREPEMKWHGVRSGYGPTGRMIESRKVGAALYNARGDYIGLLDDVSVASDGATKRLPVYYSRVWRPAVQPRDSKVFLSLGIASGLLMIAAAGFAFICRRHLVLKPIVSGVWADGRGGP